MDTQAPVLKYRIQSIDILRGLVMVIMALDHVRDYFHIAAFTDDPTNLATTTTALFFTRWITHFCAPVFLFLSGVSAYLVGQKKTNKELSSFLIKRGLWLVMIELTVVTLAWTFNPLFNAFVLQVIWAIGWSMVILGLLVRTSFKTIVITGLIIFFFHNLLDYITVPPSGAGNVLLNLFFFGSFSTIDHLGTSHVAVDGYGIIPWAGIMMVGYGFGYFYQSKIKFPERKKALLVAGYVLMAVFIFLRLINRYGDPAPWSQQKNFTYTVLSFLNVTKYPPSLLYCCMTLGPALLLLVAFEKMQTKLSKVLIVYGRVPFFYYICHLYLIHLICVMVFFITGHTASQITGPGSPFFFRPQHFGFNLIIVYAIWISVVMVLYFPTKWYTRYKGTHYQWWLSYL